MDPTLVIEGGAAGAAAVGFARRRPRRSRVRREPIDVQLIAAEFAESPPRGEHEIVAALEAEVQRLSAARSSAANADATDTATLEAPPFETTPIVQPTTLIPLGPVTPDMEPASPQPEPAPLPPSAPVAPEGADALPPSGLPLDQVRAWLEQVKDDLQKVQARLEHLEFEHRRLQDQQHLVAELISSSEPA